MTSHCMNCGSDKGSNFHANYCDACNAAMAGAEAAAVAEHRNVYIAKRAALAERAHNAHRNFVDPRTVDRKTTWLYGNAPATEGGPHGDGQ